MPAKTAFTRGFLITIQPFLQKLENSEPYFI
jgi:hypothetical protein